MTIYKIVLRSELFLNQKRIYIASEKWVNEFIHSKFIHSFINYKKSQL